MNLREIKIKVSEFKQNPLTGRSLVIWKSKMLRESYNFQGKNKDAQKSKDIQNIIDWLTGL